MRLIGTFFVYSYYFIGIFDYYFVLESHVVSRYQSLYQSCSFLLLRIYLSFLNDSGISISFFVTYLLNFCYCPFAIFATTPSLASLHFFVSALNILNMFLNAVLFLPSLPLGGPLCPHKKKKKTENLKILRNIRKVLKLYRMIA